MSKQVPKKYMLVFEPIYDSSQYAIHFEEGGATVTRIKKYTDKALDVGAKGQVKKNLLVEIDKAVASMPNLEVLFQKYVNPSIFNYRRNNLHKIFIGYLYNNYMYTLDLSLNNKELLDKLGLVTNNMIHDRDGINGLINLILDNNDGFYKYIEQMHNAKKTKLSSSTFEVICKLKYFERQKIIACDTEICNEFEYNKEFLKASLTSYKEYRELFLLRQGYIKKLEKEREILEEKKEKLSWEMENNKFKSFSGTQMHLFGEEDIYTPKGKVKKK